MSETAVTRIEPPKAFRWAVLVLISLAMFGNYYVYDSISPLADVLKAQLGFSDANIGLLNAIYSFPNIFMVLIGGIIIDRIGTRRATLLFGVLCFAGAALTALSGTLAVMAAGRLIFGLGAESLIVAVTTAIAKWFRGKELSFAFGVNLTIARLGSFAALNAPTWAAPAYANWQWPLLISVGFATFCVTGALLYWVLEKRAEALRPRRREHGQGRLGGPLPLRHLLLVRRRPLHHLLLGDLPVPDLRREVLHGGARHQPRDGRVPVEHADAVRDDLHAALRPARGQGGQAGDLHDVRVAAARPRLPDDGVHADARLVLFEVRLPFVEMAFPVYLPMVMMGIAFSLIPAVMWPSVAYLVDQSKLGTAYGLDDHDPEHRPRRVQPPDRLGERPLAGQAANPAGYTPGMWMFSVLGFAGLLFALLLRRRETGPHAHGLETITTATPRG